MFDHYVWGKEKKIKELTCWMITLYEKQKKRHRCIARLLDFVGEGEGGVFWENSFETSIYQGWNRSPTQVGCMRQVLRAGALGRPRGMGWGGRQEGGSGWGTHVNPWLIHVNVWQKPPQYCKVISLQLIKINGEEKRKLSQIKYITLMKALLKKTCVSKFINLILSHHLTYPTDKCCSIFI